jgi:mannose-6-phosphate isomerase class I
MIIQLQPIFKEKIWGGDKIVKTFGYFTTMKNIGECWGISGYPKSESIIKSGPFEGRSLSSLWKEEKHLFGNHPSPAFPILVKIIDAKDDLSIQVHPDDAYAQKFQCSGKIEWWHIIENDPNSKIIIGHKAKTKEEFLKYVLENQFTELVNYYPIKKNDSFLIRPGTIHSICRGTMLLEIQQSSDITFRLFDYGRLEKGMPRQLHLKEAIDVVSIPDEEVIHDSRNDYFSIEEIHPKGMEIASSFGDFLIVMDGQVQIDSVAYPKGTFLVLTCNSDYFLSGQGLLFRIRLLV